MNDSDQFAESVLLILSWEDEPLGLTECMERAQALANARHGTRDLAYSTQRNVRRRLMKDELVEQLQRNRHFYLRLTDAGVDAAEQIPPDPEDARPKVPPIPFRFNGGAHRLDRQVFGEVIRLANQEEVDLIVIPRSAKTKVRYWDER